MKAKVDKRAGAIPDYLLPYWSAFAHLSGDRQCVAEMIPLPSAPGAPPLMVSRIRELRIPFRAIDRYAKRFGVADEEFDELLHLINAMDAEYLAVLADEHASVRTEESESDGP